MSTGLAADDDVEEGHSLQQGDGGLGQEEGDHPGQNGKTGGHGHGQHSEVGGQVDEEEVGVPSGLKGILAGQMKSCHILGRRKAYKDFEKNIYLHHALKFDWREVNEDMDVDEVRSEKN
jgi:hypothetical protein